MNQDIDRVLRGLSSTTPAHMEQRVLAALAQRQTRSEKHESPRRPWIITPRLSWTLAGLAAAAVLAAIVIVPRVHRATQQVTAHHDPVAAQPDAPQQAANTVPHPPLTRPRNAQPPHHEQLPHIDTPRPILAADLDPTTCHCDPLAIAEASAPSHPSPPVPLTREERHMVMLVSSGEPQQLAVLDPNLRDLEFQRERADFNRFFASQWTEASTSTNSTSTSKQGNEQP